MGRLIPVSEACGCNCNNPISPVIKILLVVGVVAFVFGLYTTIQKAVDTEKTRQSQFVKMLNNCECAKYKERNIIAVNGILSGRIYVKTVVECENGSILTGLSDVDYFRIKHCEDK